jgi:hypothetical protein
VRLSPLGTSTTVWPIVPAPDNRWCWVCSSRLNENWWGKPKYSKRKCPNDTSSTINSTWPDLESNPGRRCGKLAISYAMAFRADAFDLILYSEFIKCTHNWLIMFDYMLEYSMSETITSDNGGRQWSLSYEIIRNHTESMKSQGYTRL